jgi:membrane protein implicated in regulation of membrane protease activity
MTLITLLEWWNLVYVVPFGMAVMYLALYVFTGITFGDADADADLGAESTVHVEAHVVDSDMDSSADYSAGLEGHAIDSEMDADIDADMDADHDAGHDASHGLTHPRPVLHGHHGAESTVGELLSLLGIGKIPLSLALMIFLLSWGFSGVMLNALLVKWLGARAVVALISLPAALVVSATFTGLAAALIGKLIPSDQGPKQRRQDLVGRAGEAIFDIDASFGMAGVRGDAGDLFQVPCRTATGKPRIPKGSRIVLFNYNREEGVFQVAPFDA